MELTWEVVRWIITVIIIPAVYAIRSKDRKEMEEISRKANAALQELNLFKIAVSSNFIGNERFERTEDRTDKTLAALTDTINENHRMLVNLINSKGQ